MIVFNAVEGAFRVLSWGMGVQSTTLAVMAALGDTEPLDAIIAADVGEGAERRRTMESLNFYKPWLEARGQRVYVVNGGNIVEEAAKPHVHIPFRVESGAPISRQCTGHFKIVPVKRKVRQLMGFDAIKPPHPKSGSVEMWMGISWDEMDRMKESQVKFRVNRYPLIEKRMTRMHCEEYLKGKGLPIPVSSACIFCPFRSVSSWIELRDDDPGEFEFACQFDEKHRQIPELANEGLNSETFHIYKFGGALREANLDKDVLREKKNKQLKMFCDDMCFT